MRRCVKEGESEREGEERRGMRCGGEDPSGAEGPQSLPSLPFA